MSGSSDTEMSGGDRRRRAAVMVFWHLTNPFVRRLAFLMPWLVVLETTGRRSGKPRRTSLARGLKRFNLYARSGPRTLGIDPRRAGVNCAAQIEVTSDGPFELTLARCNRVIHAP